MKRFPLRRAAAALAVAAALSPQALAYKFTNTYFFGDSLTDSGALAFNPANPKARWTTGNGDLYADYLARKYGVVLTPVNPNNPLLGKAGNNYAQGGSGANALTPGLIGVNGVLPLKGQFDAFFANNGSIDPNALYTVWIGGNDISGAVAVAQSQGASAGQAYIATAVQNELAQISALRAKGAKYIMVANVPDVGKTPNVMYSSAGAVAQGFLPAVSASAGTLAQGVLASINPALAGNAPLVSAVTASLQAMNASPSTLTTVAGAAQVGARTGLNGGATDPSSQAAAITAAASGAENGIAQAYATLVAQNVTGVLVAQGLLPAAQQAAAVQQIAAALTPQFLGSVRGQVGAVYGQLSAAASGFANTVYNGALSSGLAQIGNIIAVDINRLMSEALANPAVYGFGNVTGTTCPIGTSANGCTTSSAGYDGSKTFFFADGVHPTPETHRMVAQYMASILDAPMSAAQLITAPDAVVQASNAALDQRVGLTRSVGAFDGFARLSRTDNDVDASADSLKSDGNNRALTAGVDYQLSKDLSVGVAVTRGDQETKFANNAGRYKARDYLMSGFARYTMGPLTLSSDVSVGSTRYSGIERVIQLGALSRTERGSNNTATQMSARFAAAYTLSLGQLDVVPNASLAFRKTTIGGYSETGPTGTDSTSMRYDEQEIKSMLVGAGVKASVDLGVAKPFVSANVYHDAKNDDRTVTAGLVTQPVMFTLPVYTPKANYGVLGLGASFDLSKTAGAYVAYSQMVSGGDQTNRSLSAGFQMQF
jgi:outer membrane lipase/esterase